MSEKMKKKWVNKKLRKLAEKMHGSIEALKSITLGEEFLAKTNNRLHRIWEYITDLNTRLKAIEQRSENAISADVIQMGATCAARWEEQKHDTGVIFRRLQQKDDSYDALEERVRVLEMQVHSMLLSHSMTHNDDGIVVCHLPNCSHSRVIQDLGELQARE